MAANVFSRSSQKSGQTDGKIICSEAKLFGRGCGRGVGVKNWNCYYFVFRPFLVGVQSRVLQSPSIFWVLALYETGIRKVAPRSVLILENKIIKHD